MIMLEANLYDLIKPLFAEIPGCLWIIAGMEERKSGRIFVDRLPYPQTAYIETPWRARVGVHGF